MRRRDKKEKKLKINPEKECFIDFFNIDFGVWIYVCHARKFSNAPLGLLWGQAFGPMFFVYGIFVPTWARRNGIARFLHNHLKKSFKIILTGILSDEGGKAFAKSYGYKRDIKLGWRT